MTKAKFSGCSVSVTPGGCVSYQCMVEPKSSCEFYVGVDGARVPWDSCIHLGLFGFCENGNCCRNAARQAKATLSKVS